MSDEVQPEVTTVEEGANVTEEGANVTEEGANVTEEGATVTEPEPVLPSYIPTVSLEDLLSSQEALHFKEQTDKINLLKISVPDMNDIRKKLLVWASKGFPDLYSVLSFPLASPDLCSDGVQRSLNEYIGFCSGKPLNDHIAVLQGYLHGIEVDYVYSTNTLSIVVSRGR
jgi:hypothetical protein